MGEIGGGGRKKPLKNYRGEVGNGGELRGAGVKSVDERTLVQEVPTETM